MEDEMKMEGQNLDPDLGSCSVTDELSQQLLSQEASSPKLSVTELSKELDSKSDLVRLKLLPFSVWAEKAAF